MTTDRTVALVRQAIFHVLDEGNPRSPGLEWDFNDNEERVDFADQVVAWLAAREKVVETREPPQWCSLCKRTHPHPAADWCPSRGR
jgi:hypothetical protein